ncbi:MAG: hypothetical protein AAB909_00425 [Patescibacteria group bacterium]
MIKEMLRAVIDSDQDVIDFTRIEECEKWCLREVFGGSFVLTFLWAFGKSADFGRAWEYTRKLHGAMTPKWAALLVVNTRDFISPQFRSEFMDWWRKNEGKILTSAS